MPTIWSVESMPAMWSAESMPASWSAESIYFIYLFIQYLKRCTLLAEIAILPSGPL